MEGPKPNTSAEEIAAATQAQITVAGPSGMELTVLVGPVDPIDLLNAGILPIRRLSKDSAPPGAGEAPAGSGEADPRDESIIALRDWAAALCCLGIRSLRVVTGDVEPNLARGEVHTRQLTNRALFAIATRIEELSGLSVLTAAKGKANGSGLQGGSDGKSFCGSAADSEATPGDPAEAERATRGEAANS